MDRISSLPDEILCHIGSFVSAKEAAFTTVLSKRWRNLLTVIEDLRYYHYDWIYKNGESFGDFSKRVLSLPATSRVRKFSIIIRWVTEKVVQYDDINRCLCHVMKLGVMELDLMIDVKKDDEIYTLPLEVFTCETVTYLKLGYGFVIDFIPSNAYLPSLKILRLDSIRFYEYGRCTFNALLTASPELEELFIYGVEFERWKWSFTVRSPILQRLTIRRREWESEDLLPGLDCRGLAHEFNSIILDTPALIYLEYNDFVPKEYPFVNLNSLVEAKLDLNADAYGNWESYMKDFDPMILVNALKSVEILDLSTDTMDMIHVYRKSTPVFENLVRLSVEFSHEFWIPMPTLLKKSPNLKTLIVKNHLYDESFEEQSVCPDVLSSPVEVLKIMEYSGDIDELEEMKHLLGKLSCLELVEVHTWVNAEKRVRVMDDLLMLPRASTKCNIILKNI